MPTACRWQEQPEWIASIQAFGSVTAPSLAEPTSRPVLVMHGTRDTMVDVERARESRRRLLERRVPLTYREYDMAHEIARDALLDLRGWIEDKVFAPVQLLG